MEEWEPLDEDFGLKFPFFQFLFVKGDYRNLFGGPTRYLVTKKKIERELYIFGGSPEREGDWRRKLGFVSSSSLFLNFFPKNTKIN